MISMLASIDGTIATFFESLTASLGFTGYLLIALAVEAVLVVVYGIKSAFSYEARFKKSMNMVNAWLHANKKLTTENIKEFTNILKKAPKRVAHFWQQYIMYREGGPVAYLSEENLVEKPLRTSSWLNNVKNLGIATVVWTICSLIMSFAAQANKILNFTNIVTALAVPFAVALIGAISIVIIKGCRSYNLQDMYECYHIFIRFLTNACDELPPYIELDLLFTKSELSKASRELKEFYETNARNAKRAFDEARRKEEQTVEYNFKDVGVDGALLLDRAMKESESYINKKTKIQSQMAQVEAQKDAMRRNYENIQMDLQRKIQASKENIQKLIEQQAATTSRIEVGLLRQQQDKEAKKLDELQRDYDKEETRFKADRDEHEKELARLKEIKEQSLEIATRGMAAEYQTFFEKVMKSAYNVADKRIEKEKKALIRENEEKEKELINVQTQIKRLLDENVTLRAKLGEYNPEFRTQAEFNGRYDQNGNYIYQDGSYHDEQGLFHSENGDVFNMNGEKVSKDYTDEEVDQNEREALVQAQVDQFGSYIEEKVEEPSQPENATAMSFADAIAEEKTESFDAPVEEKKGPIIEDFDWDEEPATKPMSFADAVAEVKAAQPEEEEDFAPAENATAMSFADAIAAEKADSIAETNAAEVETENKTIVEDFVWDEQPKKKSYDFDEDFLWGDEEEEEKPAAVPVDETITEAPAEEAQEEPAEEVAPVEEKKEYTGKKRGRPRKVVAAPVPAEPAKKRGRPRKEEQVSTKAAQPKATKTVAKKAEPAKAEPTKKRGRPRKEETVVKTERPKPRKRVVKKEEPVKVEPTKKRGRPRKEEAAPVKKERPKPRKRVVKKEEPAKTEPAKKRGRPRKEETPVAVEPAKKRGRPRKDTAQEVGSIARINQLISEEEEKLSRMKAFLNNEIDNVMTEGKVDTKKEKASLAQEFEDLKKLASDAKSHATGEELVQINKRLETLIKEINALNNKK